MFAFGAAITVIIVVFAVLACVGGLSELIGGLMDEFGLRDKDDRDDNDGQWMD